MGKAEQMSVGTVKEMDDGYLFFFQFVHYLINSSKHYVRNHYFYQVASFDKKFTVCGFILLAFRKP